MKETSLYEERLELELFSLQKRRLQWRIKKKIFHIFKSFSNIGIDTLLEIHWDIVTREREREGTHIDKGKNFFTNSVVENWNKLSVIVVSVRDNRLIQEVTR